MRLEERRVWLADQLRRKSIPDNVWDELVETRYAREDLDGTDAEMLVAQAQSLLRVSGSGPRRPGRLDREEEKIELSMWLDDLENERRRVFGEHVARMAAEHPDVQAFREEVLGERFPLSYEEALEEFVDEDGFIHREGPRAEQLDELTKELKGSTSGRR